MLSSSGGTTSRPSRFEGVADEPKGAELDRLKKVYFEAYPDGPERQSWKDITYVRVRPTWVRYSDFRPGGTIVEMGKAGHQGKVAEPVACSVVR